MKALFLTLLALIAPALHAQNLVTGDQAPTLLRAEPLATSPDLAACKAAATKLPPGNYRCQTDTPIVVAAATPVPNIKVWIRVALENRQFALTKPATIRYGAGARFVSKDFAAGTQDCSNGAFGGDPAPGTPKVCEQLMEVPPVLPGVINNALIPPPALGFDGPRIRSTWHDIKTGAECAAFAPGCAVAPSEAINASDIGAFREPCDFAKMAYDDPIVYPGQPGKGHLHTFFGNTGVDAFTTPTSILTGNSTCAGGTLNRSSYWMPSMIDSLTGQPIAPPSVLVYYKGNYQFDASKLVEPVPVGLRMISGSAKNMDPATSAANYVCFGPNGENPGNSPTIAAAYAKGTCKAGGTLLMSVPFPYCWDGVNLDSPDHHSHMSGIVFDPKANTFSCPATYPHVIPNIEFNVGYAIHDDTEVSRWRLSSDMDPMAPAGVTGHADYFMGWDPATGAAWTKACLTDKKDGHAYLTCDGRSLF